MGSKASQWLDEKVMGKFSGSRLSRVLGLNPEP